jgi:hypothetical protein
VAFLNGTEGVLVELDGASAYFVRACQPTPELSALFIRVLGGALTQRTWLG